MLRKDNSTARVRGTLIHDTDSRGNSPGLADGYTPDAFQRGHQLGASSNRQNGIRWVRHHNGQTSTLSRKLPQAADVSGVQGIEVPDHRLTNALRKGLHNLAASIQLKIHPIDEGVFDVSALDNLTAERTAVGHMTAGESRPDQSNHPIVHAGNRDLRPIQL